MMVGPGMPSRDRDSLDELEAIAALEGLGVLTERQRALVDEERVRDLEHAAGALFTALGRAKVHEAPEDAERRLEDLLSIQVAADAHEARRRGNSHLHDTLRDVPQRGAVDPGAFGDERAAPTPAPRTEPTPETRGLRAAPGKNGSQ